MPAVVHEWLNLAVRWAHVVAAIMWIGDSFLFMWLDSTLERPARGRAATATGEIWLTHSGGFYEVIKHRSLDHFPDRLYWFKWQSYSTWITGILLLFIVYGLGGRAMLLESTSPMSHGTAVALLFGVIAAGVLVYELLNRIPRLRGAAFGIVGLALIALLAYGLGQVFTPRAAFLMVGATVGTIMTANVFLVIVPGQTKMVAATREGRPVDFSHGVRAKERSTHNHYLTLPVLFTMLSNHFPSLYGSSHPWVVLTLMFVLGAGLKLIMNLRQRTPAVVFAGTLACATGVGLMTRPPGDGAAVRALVAHDPVDATTAQTIVQTRCISCHSARPSNPAFPAPPDGVAFDRLDQIAAYSERILVRVVETRTMPLGNLTGMTDAERATLGAWALQQRRR